MSLAFIKDARNYWTVVVGSKSYQFDETHPKYDELVQAVKDTDEKSFVNKFDTTVQLNKWGQGQFQVVDGILRYKDNEIHKVIADRILDMVKEGFDNTFMLKFVERLYKNPSMRAINELYTFLSHSFLPIDPDGYFLAYKAVTKDFKDKYTKTVDNSIGAEPEMERFKVDDDCTVGCSQGYHVGAHDYAVGFRSASDGDVMVICRVDPADVVSIPKDSNCQKLRCCKYKVVGLYEGAMTPAVVDTYSETKIRETGNFHRDDECENCGGLDYECGCDDDFDDDDDWCEDEECDECGEIDCDGNCDREDSDPF